MRWYAISGTWKLTNEKVQREVREKVQKILEAGNGIVTGGALGVDYYATQAVLDFGDVPRQLKLCLPIKVKDFCNHYLNRANEGVITQSQAKEIVD